MSLNQTERAQRLIAMGEMAATLAHEIRNPLGSMELFCSLLKKDLKDNPETLYYAEQIFQGIKNLERIINNSLQFSRDNKVKRKLCPSVKQFLKQVLSYCSDKIEKFSVEVLVEIKGLELSVEFDPYLLNQALINLIQNALDAAAESKNKLLVVQWENFADGSFKIEIIDSGQGIKETELIKIFDPFYTTKAEGTGLGLPVAHSIILSHGGSFNFETKAGVGTRVILSFPSEDSANTLNKKENIRHAG